MNFSWKVQTIKELNKVAKELLTKFSEDKIFLFVGKMGAGKTTFIKSLGASLLSKDDISSPTFSLVNEYHLENGQQIFHFDFYRIETQEEALDMGFEDYLSSGAHCFIEWPDRVEGLLPSNFVLVKISESNNIRTITAKGIKA